VLLHQTVIGQEAMEQMEMGDAYPDFVVGCVGGGSNFAGIAFPFLGANLKRGKKTRIIASTPAACPKHDQSSMPSTTGTPRSSRLCQDDTLGHDFIPRASTQAACAITGGPHCCRMRIILA